MNNKEYKEQVFTKKATQVLIGVYPDSIKIMDSYVIAYCGKDGYRIPAIDYVNYFKTSRQERAKKVIETYQIKKVNSIPTFIIKGGQKVYLITKAKGSWFCTCKDHEINRQDCKHILAVKQKFNLN